MCQLFEFNVVFFILVFHPKVQKDNTKVRIRRADVCMCCIQLHAKHVWSCQIYSIILKRKINAD